VTVSDTISFVQEQGIATLSFDNPARRNALGATELAAIDAALDALEPATRVLLITSSDDRIFCAGADLSQILEGVISGDRFQSVTNRIAALPIPTIAVLTGNVFGGGAELALSCDFRIGRTGMLLRIPAAAIGLCYPVEGVERLTRRLGPNLCKRLLVAAETFSSEQLLAHQLLDSVHSADEVRAAAQAYAETLLKLAPLSVSTMLDLIRQIEVGTYARADAEVRAKHCADSEDLQEGIRAQREKRTPLFHGR
jgi:enoyl-CoA hydratase/carnithine racemase